MDEFEDFPDKEKTPGIFSESSGKTDKILFMVASGNDNYIRFFNCQSFELAQSFKSEDHSGMPLCFDISGDKSLLAVGFEDDSFITYHFEVKQMGKEVNVIPIMRGVGHRNFINTLKFDNFFQSEYDSYLHTFDDFIDENNMGQEDFKPMLDTEEHKKMAIMGNADRRKSLSKVESKQAVPLLTKLKT